MAEISIAPVADFTAAVFAAADIHVEHPWRRRPDFHHEFAMLWEAFIARPLIECVAIAQQILGGKDAPALRSIVA
jgi:hypothetical protein